jgi:hypothetical protein
MHLMGNHRAIAAWGTSKAAGLFKFGGGMKYQSRLRRVQPHALAKDQ